MASPAPSAPTTSSPRSLAPDLARGFMLLLIALAYGSLYVGPEGLATAGGGPLVDRVTDLVRTVLVHERSYTMFTALFGYGLVMIVRKLQRGGADDRTARRLLRRRGLLLLLFGFVHGALVFSGEILGTYGLASLLLAGLVLRDDRRVRRAMVVILVVQVLVLLWLWTGAYATGAMEEMAQDATASGTTTYLASVIERAVEYPVTPPFILVFYPVLPVLLIGVLAGRRRLLEEPEANRALLVRVAVLGIGVSVAGALPLGLVNGGWWTPDALVHGVVAAAHNVTGIVGGLGYLAVFALLGGRLQVAPGAVASALAATGRRSMTAYLAMSALVAVPLAPWGLHLGERLGATGAAAAAAAAWGVAVLICVALERAGRPGPADALMRRLLYRRAAA